MPDIGVPELLIIGIIVLLLFGPAKAGDLGGALGKSIREFRKASREGDAPGQPTSAGAATLPSPQPPAMTGEASVSGIAAPERVHFCTACGARNAAEGKFCVNCGQAMAAAG